MTSPRPRSAARLSARLNAWLLAVAVPLAVALVVAPLQTSGGDDSAAQAAESATASTAAARPLLTFVSMPDFLNADIASVRGAPGWRPGDPNSVTPAWNRAIDVILDGVQSEDPDAVLVAGDQVEGHWGKDVERTGIFGPVSPLAQRLKTLAATGRHYYRTWAGRFAARRLPVYPALGDHEIGDNPWPAGGFKLTAMPTAKRTWAQRFTRTSTGRYRYLSRPRGTPYEDTAYAVRLASVLLVTVDVFRRTSAGVQVTVTPEQRAWVDRRIREARANGVRQVIVQGHTPVLRPVRNMRSWTLTLAGGRSSPFWRMLKRRHVDLYLSGEAHAMTTKTDRVVQVTNGALANWGRANYLVGRVYRDRIDLSLHRFTGRVTNRQPLWATGWKRAHRAVEFDRGTRIVGSAVLDTSGSVPALRQRTGYLREYTGPGQRAARPAIAD